MQYWKDSWICYAMVLFINLVHFHENNQQCHWSYTVKIFREDLNKNGILSKKIKVHEIYEFNN